jgi:hypothetical protein
MMFEPLVQDYRVFSAREKKYDGSGLKRITDNEALIFRRLETIWMSWAASMDHLSASQFFCQFISQFFDLGHKLPLFQGVKVVKMLRGESFVI